MEIGSTLLCMPKMPMPPCSYSALATARNDYAVSKSVVDELTRLGIMASVTITILLLFFLLLLGRIRRSVRWRYFVRYLTKTSYLLLPISITYIMGVLHKEGVHHVLYPVWAAILVYAYGGVVTITACDFNDNEETLRYVMRFLPLFFWTLWLGFLSLDMIIGYWSMVAFLSTLVCFLVLAVINARQTLEAFYKASKSKGLPGEVKPLAQYMEAQSKRQTLGLDKPDPRSMRGFMYMVWGRWGRDKNVTTIDEIWEWVTTHEDDGDGGGMEPALLAKKRGFLAKCGGKDQLRDLCLSYALFRMLLTRFAGFPPPICDVANRIHPRWLIQEILGNPLLHPLRMFRIIEVELDFLCDYFYTKSHGCGSYRFRDIWQSLAQILLIGLVAVFGIPIILDNHLEYDFNLGDMEAVVTWAILSMIISLESWKYIMVHYSDRKLVWLLCTGIREMASSNKWAIITQMRIVLIWTIKSWLYSKVDAPFLCIFWPWQRKLGQYSFLECYTIVPILARRPFSSLSRIVKLPRRGRKGDYVVPLSEQVKQAIVSSLMPEAEGELIFMLERCKNQLLSGWDQEINDASFVLVCHIATSFLESLHPIQNSIDRVHFLIANQLSKYCAYLVAFAPELLSDHVYTVECAFDDAVKQATELKMKSFNTHELYQQLITGDARFNEGNNIVVRGALLAQTLSNANAGWRPLAEFWANLLLYLALSDNVEMHGEYLARGGEFITHLWVLLTHAGVVATKSSSSPI